MKNDTMTISLFSEHPDVDHQAYVADPCVQAKLGQYPTPVWAAEALVERYFPNLGKNDFIIEPACGPGSFLMAIPDDVDAVGSEIDPRTADIARINTGRKIITGDFLAAQFEREPTLIIGNPPFNLSIIDGFLNRSHELLVDGGQVAFILPAYAFQTADRVSNYSDVWSLEQNMIPRNIYPGLSLPLMWARFTKSKVRTMIGFALYHETSDLQTIKKDYRDIINSVGKSVWRAAIAKALAALGGKANIEAIYREIEGKKPTRTRWWREQVRKVLRQATTLFKAEGDGWYSFA